ncbi:MAG: GAF domain-containing protein [Planctomycetes bacterium]|nr:GAF domain-containing protein [Planctomycetota bacterium]
MSASIDRRRRSAQVIDCFSSGKGNNDKVFLDFYESGGEASRRSVVHVAHPGDPAQLEKALTETGAAGRGINAWYVFDSLTGMLDLWGDEDVVLRFFGHICPRLYDLNTIAYWFLETEAHSQRFLAKVRHITQVVLEIGISRGIRTLTLRKAAHRRSTAIGVPQWFRVVDGKLAIAAESREDRELSLLTRMGEALGTALTPNAFFEETMNVLAGELGMIRGTVVLLDRTLGKLRIVAAHGLSSAERARGEYDIGEGITGHVVKTGLPEVVPDIHKDARFLNRTTARHAEATWPVAFICVPLKIDHETVGALSLDRPFAVESTLDKDLRLLSIVASLSAQVLKINRLLQVEKDEILVRDEQMVRELRSRYRLENLIGQSKSIQQILATAATNMSLKEALRQGRFRQDLYYRLNVVPIHLPPLRERREDIPMLVDHFLEKYNRENGKNVTKISREVLDHLLAYAWPGNVRELENCIEHAVVMSPGSTVSMSLLPPEVLANLPAKPPRGSSASADKMEKELEALLERHYKTAEDAAGAKEGLHGMIERLIISQALAEGMSQRTLAAKLGLSRTTLRKRLQEYGLDSS